MQTIIQILKVNEARSGEKNGRKWEMQDAECILLNDDGSVGEVGVCQIPKDLINKVGPGIYTAAFTLRANKSREGGRRIEASFTNFIPVPPQKPAPKASPATPA